MKRIVRITLTLMLAIAVNSCQDVSQNDTPKVSYNKDPELAAKMKNYTNADWLFQNYFEEYGVPVEFKPMLDRELKLVANGFALMYSKGEDVNESIDYLNQNMKMFIASGMLQNFVEGLREAKVKQAEIAAQRASKVSLMSKETAEEVVLDKEITPEIAENIRTGDSLWQAFADEQAALEKDHNLPYKMEDTYLKAIVVNPEMGGCGTISNPPCNPCDYEHTGADTWDWQTADIAYSPDFKSGSFNNHIALAGRNIGGGRQGRTVIDAHPDNAAKSFFKSCVYEWGGPGNKTIKEWACTKKTVEAYTYTGWTNLAKRLRSSESDLRKKVYDFAYFKSITGSLAFGVTEGKTGINEYYCSKLVWQAYKDVDVNLLNNVNDPSRINLTFIYPQYLIEHNDGTSGTSKNPAVAISKNQMLALSGRMIRFNGSYKGYTSSSSGGGSGGGGFNRQPK